MKIIEEERREEGLSAGWGGFFALLFAKRFWLGHALTNQMVSLLPFMATHLGLFSVFFFAHDVSISWPASQSSPASQPCFALALSCPALLCPAPASSIQISR